MVRHAGDGGLVMTTNPRGTKDPYKDPNAWQMGYFNECMSGFEHQVASHMIAEGMVTEGLAIMRAIHDRYSTGKRNPWNEIECSDHYSRAMASYGCFVSACGFEVHGPSGRIGFAPRWSEQNFRAPFVGPEGWGTFSQRLTNGKLDVTLAVMSGRLRLKTVSLRALNGRMSSCLARKGNESILAAVKSDGDRRLVSFETVVFVERGETLNLTLL